MAVCRSCGGQDFRAAGNARLVCVLCGLDSNQVELVVDTGGAFAGGLARRASRHVAAKTRARDEEARERQRISTTAARGLAAAALQALVLAQLRTLVRQLHCAPSVLAAGKRLWMHLVALDDVVVGPGVHAEASNCAWTLRATLARRRKRRRETASVDEEEAIQWAAGDDLEDDELDERERFPDDDDDDEEDGDGAHAPAAEPETAKTRLAKMDVVADAEDSVDVSKWLSVPDSLIICWFACLHQRQAVLLSDLRDWAAMGQLPFLTFAFDGGLPSHLSAYKRMATLFTPTRLPSTVVLYARARNLALCSLKPTIDLPPLNAGAVGARIFAQLHVPATDCARLVERVVHLIETFTEYPATIEHCSNERPMHLRVAAACLTVLKLRYGREMDGQGNWSCASCSPLALHRLVPAAQGRMEEYLRWCERRMLPAWQQKSANQSMSSRDARKSVHDMFKRAIDDDDDDETENATEGIKRHDALLGPAAPAMDGRCLDCGALLRAPGFATVTTRRDADHLLEPFIFGQDDLVALNAVMTHLVTTVAFIVDVSPASLHREVASLAHRIQTEAQELASAEEATAPLSESAVLPTKAKTRAKPAKKKRKDKGKARASP